MKFMWIPNPTGIDGNEQVDAVAKLAAQLQPEYIQINYRQVFDVEGEDQWRVG